MAEVLLVEDNDELATFMRSALERRGHVVTHSETAEDALQRLKGGARFQVMVLDGMLPGMDGPDLLRELDATTIEPVPTVITSALLDLSRITASRWTIVERVEKPFLVETLINAVENAARKNGS